MTIRLIALGGLRCTCDDSELDWLGGKWLSAALLLYLGVERRATREHVLAMFWPESDPSKAHRRLNQTLYSLRKALGSDCIQTNGPDLIAGDALQSDVIDFEQYVSAGRNADAISLYGGPFLSGVHLASQVGFESWVDGRRARCGRLFRDACRASVEERLAAGDASGAIATARRWITPDPLDDEAQHRLIELVARSGDRAEALAQYGLYARLLSTDDLKPLDETEELVAGIRRGEAGAPQLRHSDRTESASAPGSEPAEALKAEGSESASSRQPPRRPNSRTAHMLRRRRFLRWIVPTPRLSLILPAAVLLLGLGAVTASKQGWTLSWPPWSATEGANIDPGLVAVFPFRVNGADPSLSYLGEGMLDLLSAKLTGDAGPRAVDPRTLTSAWRQAGRDERAELSREEALALARALGAGRLVLGEVVNLPGRVVLTASLSDVRSGKAETPISVEGPPDSLLSLVDRLAAGLLSIQAGERERLASLMTTSLPALGLYLEGQSAYRAGRPDVAMSHFSRAVEMDSSFALASLMRWRARSRVGYPGSAIAMLSQAWRYRERLGRRDRAFLEAVVGPNWPGYSSAADRISARLSLVQLQPDDPHAWFLLGDMLATSGPPLEIPDSTALRRAAHAYSRALALDSTFFPALESLTGLSLLLGDRADARRYSELYLERAPAGLGAEIVRCMFLANWGGMAALPEIIARIDSVGGTLPGRCLHSSHSIPETAEVSAALAAYLGRRIDEPEVLRHTGLTLYRVARDRGRPGEATLYLHALRRAGHLDSLGYLITSIRDGLYWNGDSAAAARAATALAAQLVGWPVDARSEAQAGDPVCVLGQWHLAQGETAAAAPIIERLRALAGSGYSWEEATRGRCAEALATWYAVQTGATDAAARIARLDSLLMSFGALLVLTDQDVNFILAQLLESTGDRRSAQRVLSSYPVALARYGSTVLRERGRIAALLGDTAGAVKAYRRYLARRSDPEPVLLPEVEHVRAELARLTTIPR
jgi:DNA-binding SARP family transcriptional activator